MNDKKRSIMTKILGIVSVVTLIVSAVLFGIVYIVGVESSAVLYTILVIGLITLIILICFVIYSLLQSNVLKPLNRIKAEIDEITPQNMSIDAEENLSEFNSLAVSVNNMLGRINPDSNVTEEDKQKLYYDANFDSLTGLRNSTSFMTVFNNEISEVTSNGENLLIYLFILEDFKLINERLGYAAGDNLLKTLSNRLKNNLNDATIARLEGVKFIVAAKGNNNPERAKIFAEGILNAFGEPFLLNEQNINIKTSLGFVSYPQHGRDIPTLLNNAELAMNESRAKGGNVCIPYTKEMETIRLRKIGIRNKLQDVVNNDCKELKLFFLPKVNMSTGKIIGCEALMRWHTAEREISPSEFIPIAEETGLIVPLSWWLIRECCKYGKKFEREGIQCSISINIPAQVLLQPYMKIWIE